MNKHLCIGPGGPNCPCCFPPRGSRSRAKAFRRAKRADAREAFKVEEETMQALLEDDLDLDCDSGNDDWEYAEDYMEEPDDYDDIDDEPYDYGYYGDEWEYEYNSYH